MGASPASWNYWSNPIPVHLVPMTARWTKAVNSIKFAYKVSVKLPVKVPFEKSRWSFLKLPIPKKERKKDRTSFLFLAVLLLASKVQINIVCILNLYILHKEVAKVFQGHRSFVYVCTSDLAYKIVVFQCLLIGHVSNPFGPTCTEAIYIWLSALRIQHLYRIALGATYRWTK